jgi:hypothetical protein
MLGVAFTAVVGAMLVASTSEAATSDSAMLLAEAQMSAQAEMQTLNLEFQKTVRTRLDHDHETMIADLSNSPSAVDVVQSAATVELAGITQSTEANQ